MPPRPIWIDCDPGQDDAVMLLLALAAPDELDVRGISTVVGNVPAMLGASNARAVVELAGRAEVPVFAGSDRPQTGKPLAGNPQTGKPLAHAARRGATGLEGWAAADPKRPVEPLHGVEALVAAIRAVGADGLTLVATGPLTNLATALIAAPDIAAQIREIAIMGGVVDAGPRAPAAEFNFACDADAVHVVLGCRRPLTVHGLDVTLQAVATPARLARIAAIGTAAARAAHAMLAFTDPLGRSAYATDGAPLHDPCPLAALLEPDLFGGFDAQIAVDGAGRVMLDRNAPPNARWIDRLDADGYFELICEALARLP
jgi:purine nucleosidase